MLNWLRWHWHLFVLFIKIINYRELLSEVFDNLEEDDGTRYQLELRQLKRKVSKGISKGTLTKPILLRNEFFNTLNSQQEEFFEDNLEMTIAMMASWLIIRKSDTKEAADDVDQLETSIDPIEE